MATIKDVAKKSGFSVGTVSAVLNDKPGVSPKTRERILEVIRELGFTPNTMAQGLVTKESKTISLVVSGPASMDVVSNPLFFEVIKHVVFTLNKYGYKAILNIMPSEDMEIMVQQIARSRYSDAIMVVATRMDNEELVKLLHSIKLPSMTLFRDAVDSKIFSVAVDNFGGAKMATNFLIRNGHKRIVFVGKMEGYPVAEARLAGYLEAMQNHGIDVDPALILDGDYYRSSGHTAVKDILNMKPRPTAVFAANDLMAVGILEALQKEGVNVPEDISLMGFDNISNSHLLVVPLTTVSVPASEMGSLAAKKMAGFLKGRDTLADQMTVRSELVIRKSVKKITN